MDTVLYKLVDEQSRIFVLENTELIFEANPFKEKTATEVFCAVMAFTCLLHGIMPEAKRVTVRLETPNPSAFLAFGADKNGDVQGYASEGFDEMEFDSFQSMIGESGSLKIVRDNGYGAVFTGIVDVAGYDLERSLSRYFLMSEQTRSVYRFFSGIHSDERCGRGVLAQALPFADEKFVSIWENRLERGKDALSCSEQTMDMLQKTVFENAAVAETWTLRLNCSCDRQSVLEMLLRLDESDIGWAVTDTREIEVRCGKCGRMYRFAADEITGSAL